MKEKFKHLPTFPLSKRFYLLTSCRSEVRIIQVNLLHVHVIALGCTNHHYNDRRYMAAILPIQRKTQSNQSINQLYNDLIVFVSVCPGSYSLF